MSFSRRSALGILASQARLPGQPRKPVSYVTLKKAIEAIYEIKNGTPIDILRKETKTVLSSLIGKDNPHSDECVAVLLQFEDAETWYPGLRADIIERGDKMLPLLRKHRDRPFPIPFGVYKRGIHSRPAWRRRDYDEVIESIQKKPYYGLSTDVEFFVIPLLDSLAKGDEQATFDLLGQTLSSYSPAGYQALAILIDYPFDASHGEGRDSEIVKRGKRMLPFLRQRLTDFSVTLSRRYPPKFRNLNRNEDIEYFVEAIECGATEWH